VIAALWTGPGQLTTAAECVQITGLVREPLPLADRTVPGLSDHDHVGIERIQLAPLATTAEPDRLGSSHRRARRRRA
jgi:hypothetical protein